LNFSHADLCSEFRLQADHYIHSTPPKGGTPNSKLVPARVTSILTKVTHVAASILSSPINVATVAANFAGNRPDFLTTARSSACDAPSRPLLTQLADVAAAHRLRPY